MEPTTTAPETSDQATLSPPPSSPPMAENTFTPPTAVVPPPLTAEQQAKALEAAFGTKEEQEKAPTPEKLTAEEVTKIFLESGVPITKLLGHICRATQTQVVLAQKAPGQGVGIEIYGPASVGDAYGLICIAQAALQSRVIDGFRNPEGNA